VAMIVFEAVKYTIKTTG